ncbi:hypothetical protein BCR43DRAFT_490283 [Syncephalastrum racemosum]|uniref:Uncharacterized protein n=1 Tax=Syncephalastrum racemosum TaxID=13706 RepID=A0A1X2HFP2_SYNRA|nr:hypothetical protein BCR43DRAFT_490283 [Syncephalastrum racemosum]
MFTSVINGFWSSINNSNKKQTTNNRNSVSSCSDTEDALTRLNSTSSSCNSFPRSTPPQAIPNASSSSTSTHMNRRRSTALFGLSNHIADDYVQKDLSSSW